MSNNKTSSDGSKGSSGIFIKWLKLFISLGVIGLFLCVIGPWFAETSLVKDHFKVIRDHNINAGMYYYTEIEEAYEAEAFIQDNLEYNKTDENSYLLVSSIVVGSILFALIFWLGFRFIPLHQNENK